MPAAPSCAAPPLTPFHFSDENCCHSALAAPLQDQKSQEIAVPPATLPLVDPLYFFFLTDLAPSTFAALLLDGCCGFLSWNHATLYCICDFDYFHIGKAVGERVSYLKDTGVVYEDGSHVFFLNSRYTEANASKPILEFLDLIRTNDVNRPYETPLAQAARKRIQEVCSDKELEVSYMTFAQKMLDERRLGYAEGREETLKENIAALKGLIDPAVIAERFKVSLEQVMEILNH